MRCPVCVDVDLAISSREGVEVDFCPQCRGVWLDRGELDKVIDRVATTLEPAARARDDWDDRSRRGRDRDDRDDRDDDRYDPRRRRKRGFLDDIFDFD
jgi:Zn-finger nucleic acid-binding protein